MIRNPFSPLALLGRFTVGRFFLFRKELGTLWRAFRHKATPLHLKLAMLLVPLYLVSPIDIIPDLFLGFGIIDDLVIVPLLVNWIFKLLPSEVRGEPVRATTERRTERGTVIDGSARRR